MSQDLVAIVIQAGAVGLLAMVLWQVGQKIDVAMSNMQALLMRMIDLVSEAKQSASEAKEQARQNWELLDKRPKQ